MLCEWTRIAMASWLHFLPVPAPDGIVQRGALVVGKEVADILVEDSSSLSASAGQVALERITTSFRLAAP